MLALPAGGGALQQGPLSCCRCVPRQHARFTCCGLCFRLHSRAREAHSPSLCTLSPTPTPIATRPQNAEDEKPAKKAKKEAQAQPAAAAAKPAAAAEEEGGPTPAGGEWSKAQGEELVRLVEHEEERKKVGRYVCC